MNSKSLTALPNAGSRILQLASHPSLANSLKKVAAVISSACDFALTLSMSGGLEDNELSVPPSIIAASTTTTTSSAPSGSTLTTPTASLSSAIYTVAKQYKLEDIYF